MNQNELSSYNIILYILISYVLETYDNHNDYTNAVLRFYQQGLLSIVVLLCQPSSIWPIYARQSLTLVPLIFKSSKLIINGPFNQVQIKNHDIFIQNINIFLLKAFKTHIKNVNYYSSHKKYSVFTPFRNSENL